MNGISTTADNVRKAGDNNAEGVGEATKKITSVMMVDAPLPMASSSSMTVDDNTLRRKQHTRRKNHQQQQMQKNGTLSSGVALSGGSTIDNDTSYCTEIARRVVARGALHLGFEGMEGEALDVLGNVLLGYMKMVSTLISTNVELSGRSSAHVNAYDAINVVANCTAPVATQVTTTACSVRLKGEDASQQQQQQQEWGWEGLASFLFGPDWISIPLEGEEVDNTTTHAVNATSSSSSGESITSVAAGAAAIHHANGKSSLQVNGHSPPLMLQQPKVGGKMLNSVGNGKELSNMITAGSTTEKGHVTFALDRRNSKGGIVSGGDGRTLESKVGDSSLCNIGWNAPYPNTIPAFPLVTNPEVVANPHRWSSGSRILATEIETCRESAATMDNKYQRNNDGPDNNNNNNSKIAQLRDEVADRAMRAALRIPDDVFTKFDTVWGMIDNNSSSYLMNTNQKKTSSVATTATAASKQTVVLLSTKSNQNTTIDTVRPIIRHHASPYVPNFLPPYPTDYYSDMASNNLSASIATTAVRDNFLSRMYHTNRGEKRKSSLDPAVTTSSSSSSSDGNINKKINVSERDIIRRSVIGLGRAVGPKYWGSVNLDDDDDDDDISDNAAGRDTMMRSKSTISNPGTVESSSLPSSSNKKSSLDASQVLPLGRASGSRLSKILEGSMNVS